MTNADRIRSMTDEELAKFHGENACPPEYNWSGGCERGDDDFCEKCWIVWLQTEEEE